MRHFGIVAPNFEIVARTIYKRHTFEQAVVTVFVVYQVGSIIPWGCQIGEEMIVITMMVVMGDGNGEAVAITTMMMNDNGGRK